MIHISRSLTETREIAKKFLRTLPKEDEALVVAFQGDLGAGKTAFIQALALKMGVDEVVTSPTFVIQKKYFTRPNFIKQKLFGKAKFDTLVHIDAYRLSNGDELKKLKFDETLKMPNTLICIEWPKNVESALPTVVREVKCEFIDESTHSYEF